MLETGSRKRRLLVASAVAAAWVLGVANLGAALTDLGPWYYALKQPPWKPPDLWFGPAWTLIFTLTAVAGVRAWMALEPGRERAWLLAAFGVNSVLNVAWSGLFFALRRPDWALIEWAPFWLSIGLLVWRCGRAERRSGALVLVYLAWVTFAGALNLAVVKLNGPFGGGG
jgi:tryptophan-rich sensory protein